MENREKSVSLVYFEPMILGTKEQTERRLEWIMEKIEESDLPFFPYVISENKNGIIFHFDENCSKNLVSHNKKINNIQEEYNDLTSSDFVFSTIFEKFDFSFSFHNEDCDNERNSSLECCNKGVPFDNLPLVFVKNYNETKGFVALHQCGKEASPEETKNKGFVYLSVSLNDVVDCMDTAKDRLILISDLLYLSNLRFLPHSIIEKESNIDIYFNTAEYKRVKSNCLEYQKVLRSISENINIKPLEFTFTTDDKENIPPEYPEACVLYLKHNLPSTNT